MHMASNLVLYKIPC